MALSRLLRLLSLGAESKKLPLRQLGLLCACARAEHPVLRFLLVAGRAGPGWPSRGSGGGCCSAARAEHLLLRGPSLGCSGRSSLGPPLLRCLRGGTPCEVLVGDGDLTLRKLEASLTQLGVDPDRGCIVTDLLLPLQLDILG